MFPIRQIIIAAVFYVFASAVSAQPVVDSLLIELRNARTAGDSASIYEDLVFEQGWTDPSQSLAFATDFVSLAKRMDNTSVEADAYNAMGHACKLNKDFGASFTYHFASASIHKSSGNTRALARVYTNLAGIMNELGDFQGALEMLIEADNLPVAELDSAQHAHINNQMAIASRELGKFDDAVKYFYEAIQWWTALRETNRVESAQMSLGILYTQMREFEKAGQIFSSLEQSFRAGKKPVELGLLLENMGNNYMEQGKYEDAEIKFKESLSIWQQQQSVYDIGIGYYDLAENNLRSGNFQEALRYSLLSVAICDSLAIDDYMLKNNENLAEIYQELNMPAEALTYLKLASDQREIIHSNEREMLAIRLQAKYSAEKKEQEIELLKTSSQLNLAKAERQKLYTQLTVVGGIILLLLGLLVFNRYRTNIHVKELELRNKIASDLHDDVGSSLSSIRMLSEFAASRNQQQEMSPILQKISANAKETVERIGDIVWSINPRNDKQGSIFLHMKNYLHETCAPVGVQTILHDYTTRTYNFNVHQRKNLYLIFKESVNNSLKYATPKTIVVSLHETARNLVLAISDDGTGFTVDEHAPGHGLKNIRMRAEELTGELDIISQPGHGTSLTITVPLTHVR